MEPISFHPQEINYTSNNPEIGDLPVVRTQYPDGAIVLVSCWKPDWKDRLRILFGRPIYLHIWGTQHPPVALDTENPFK